MLRDVDPKLLMLGAFDPYRQIQLSARVGKTFAPDYKALAPTHLGVYGRLSKNSNARQRRYLSVLQERAYRALTSQLSQHSTVLGDVIKYLLTPMGTPSLVYFNRRPAMYLPYAMLGAHKGIGPRNHYTPASVRLTSAGMFATGGDLGVVKGRRPKRYLVNEPWFLGKKEHEGCDELVEVTDVEESSPYKDITDVTTGPLTTWCYHPEVMHIFTTSTPGSRTPTRRKT